MNKNLTTTPLAKEICVPCQRGRVSPATASEIKAWVKKFPGWSVVKKSGVPTLQRSFKFKAFKDTLGFTVKLGALADKQDHHQNVLVQWENATVEWSTHSLKNLHRNDFIMAGKTDRLYRSLHRSP